MSESNDPNPFYATLAAVPREMLCGFCLEPLTVSASLAFFPMTGVTLVYRRTEGGRELITCDESCHPLLSQGLDRADIVERGRYTYPPVLATCEACRTAIDRERWRQIGRRAALALMRRLNFGSYEQALAHVNGEHDMMWLHRIVPGGRAWVTAEDLLERRDELPPNMRHVRLVQPIAVQSANRGADDGQVRDSRRRAPLAR